jgi:hypothetical protein
MDLICWVGFRFFLSSTSCAGSHLQSLDRLRLLLMLISTSWLRGRPNSFMGPWANMQEGSSNLLFLGPVCNDSRSNVSFYERENGTRPTSIKMTFFNSGGVNVFFSVALKQDSCQTIMKYDD